MRIATAALFILFATPLAAFERVVERDEFLSLVEGRTLTRLGVALEVRPDIISGRAFGQAVEGRWEWRDGWFCRSLRHGGTDLGDNCQEVLADGTKMRFRSDRGTGIHADFRLE